VLLRELRVVNLRNVDDVRIDASPGFNVLTGANGAGKTTLLEAVFLLSHAYSFRTRRGDVLVQRGAAGASVFGLVEGRDGRATRLGFEQADGRWRARVNGAAASKLSDALRHCAVVAFDPGAHALISGVSDERRRFLDWGVFHVEPNYPELARRYRRTLNQRNASLRDGSAGGLDIWDEELARAALPLAAARRRYAETLRPVVVRLLQEYLPELGAAEFRLFQGWPQGESLTDVLQRSRETDRSRGHTTRGPHRADWSLAFPAAPRREHLSRGQEKLCAIAASLAQAELFALDRGEWPVVLLDDLPSELDSQHQDQVVRSLASAEQIWVTGTEFPDTLLRLSARTTQFHVEQGRVRRLV
jgi:DNA replication and repair protein RecF